MADHRAYESQRMKALRAGSLAVAGFLGLLVPWRLAGLPGGGPLRIMAVHAALSCAAFLGAAWLLGRWRTRLSSAEGPALGLALLGLAVTASQMGCYGRIDLTTDLLLTSLMSGALLQRRRTLALFQAVLVLLWGGLGTSIAGWATTLSWLMDVVLAGVLAFALQFLMAQGNRALLRRIDRQRALIRAHVRLLSEFREARAEIRALEGLIPICAHCKKVRDDQGFWRQVEQYLEAHGDVQFTHGICPDCAAAFRAELKGRR